MGYRMNERTKPYTVTELANEAGVSVAYVRRLVSEGKIAGHRLGPLWMIPADVGRAWLASRRARWEKF